MKTLSKLAAPILCGHFIAACIEQPPTAVVTNVAPTLSEKAAIGVVNTPRPTYAFTSTKAGDIQYSGACKSLTTQAQKGPNTITFETLAYGTHADCTIQVVDSTGNASAVLAITAFEVTGLQPVVRLDFEGPSNIAGEAPQQGFFFEAVSDRYTQGKQITAHSADALPTQCLMLQAGNSFEQTLGLSSDEYHIRFDLKPRALEDDTITQVSFDWGETNQHTIDIQPDGQIQFLNHHLGNFSNGDVLRFEVILKLNDGTAEITLNEEDAVLIPLAQGITDLHHLRFYQMGYYYETTNATLLIDNIEIDAILREDTEFPPADSEGDYVISFESPTGVNSIYKEDGFTISGPPIIRPSGMENVADSTSTSAALSAQSNAHLYHQHGFPFQLKQMRIAKYSTFIPDRDLVFRGIKSNGETIEKTIEASAMTMNFQTQIFDTNWSDLKHVELPDLIAIDDITLNTKRLNAGFK